MTKEILIQYCDLQEEIKDLRKRIQKKEDEIKKVSDGGAVIDCVKGGDGGIQNYKIVGFPYPEYSKKKTSLIISKAKLQDQESYCLEIKSQVEDYINSISDSRIRRIFRFHYLDNLGWTNTAIKMGGKATADSIRMEHNRFLDKCEECSKCSVDL